MKTFRAHTSFIPESVVMGMSRLTAPICIIPKTDYKTIDTNQGFGIYLEVSAPSIEDATKIITQQIYLSPKEISDYGELQNLLTKAELKRILDGISFVKSCIDFSWGWEILEIEGLGWDSDENLKSSTRLRGFLINTTFKRPDINTGIVGVGRGRRMWIEETASETSVVMTAWVCVELIIKHEAMESFIYKNAKILNPHKSLTELAYPNVMSNIE